MKIFVLGLPGSGKTTLGKALATAAKVLFVDLDTEIERTAAMRFLVIFKTHNEDYFRKLESRQLKDWCRSEGDFVMATGGGTPCFFDNINIINQSGTSIFLDVNSSVIVRRILKTDLTIRPLFADTHPDDLKDKIEFMRSQRIPYYRQAHHTIGEGADLQKLLEDLKKVYPR